MHNNKDIEIAYTIRKDLTEICELAQSHCNLLLEEEVSAELRGNNVCGIVARRNNKIIGYLAYALTQTEVEILHIIVDEQAVFGCLTKKIMSGLSPKKRHTVFMNVNEEDTDLLNFFKAAGFKSDGILWDYFSKEKRDAIRMVFSVKTAEIKPKGDNLGGELVLA